MVTDTGFADRVSSEDKMASMISATRVSVSMAIAELRNDGVLEGTRGEYRLNEPALREIAHDLA